MLYYARAMLGRLTTPPVTIIEPTISGVGNVAAGSGVITPAWPVTNNIDEIGILIVQTSNQALATPTDWAVLFAGTGTGTPAAAGGTRLYVFWKRGTVTNEPAPSVGDSGDHQIGRIISIQGARLSGDPVMAVSTGHTGFGTSITANAFDTTDEKAMVIAAVAVGRPDSTSTTVFSSWTNASLDSIIEQVDNSTTSGTGGGIGAASGIKAVAGTVSATTINMGGSSEYESVQFAIAAEGT